jgi:TetR/AcrR family transcriptional regulator, transcriptional repressor for nem operon
MRYPKDRKEQSRQKIVQTAVQAFNQHGVDGIGIADIMKEAGLTQGAFSGHFSSKEELLREAIDEGFTQGPFMPADQADQPLGNLIRRYLTKVHRDNVPRSCLAGTLTAEIARHPFETRQVFISHLRKNFAAIDSKLSSKKQGAARRREVMAIFALLMGSLEISRLTKGTELSDEMLKAGIQAAEKLISG